MTGELPLLPLVVAGIPSPLAEALATDGVPTVDFASDPRGGRFVLFDSRRWPAPTLGEGQIALDVRAALAGLPIEQLDDERTAIGRWRVGPFTVEEEISLCDKAALRREALERLRSCVRSAGGVWLRIAPYPHRYRTAFCLRLDHDRYLSADLTRTLAALRGAEHATTHFVCASTHVAHADAIAALAGLDIGSHGYWHHSYRDPREQRRNIERGVDALRAAGLRPRGFAAPHGRYTPGLGAMLDDLGIDYSSEFGWLCDDLPRRQPGARAWQAPIHPVCLGIVLEAARREAARDRAFPDGPACAAWTAEYFAEAAAARHAAGEPLFFYGHPDARLGRYPLVVDRLLAAVRELPDVWWTGLSRLIDWWTIRHAARFRAFAGDRPGDWIVECQPLAARPGAPLAIELVEGCELSQWEWVEGRSVLSSRTAARRTLAPPTPGPQRVGLRPSWRDRLRRLLDYERETPLQELLRDRWQARAKRAIRILRGAERPVHRVAATRSAPLRVRFVGSLSASIAPGGGEVQMASLIEWLSREGVDARTWRPWEDGWRDFDILHLVGSCPEHLPLVDAARRAGKPVVLSPVAWFDGPSYFRSSRGWGRKAAAPMLLASRRAFPWLPGWRKRLYQAVDGLLPNSHAEADQLARYFAVSKDRLRVVPNGVDPRMEQIGPEPFVERFGVEGFVLCSGRLEPRKNQLALVEALAESDVPVVLLGDVVPGHESYLAACRRAAGGNLRFLPRLAPDDPLLASAYAAAGCLAQPSWFETPGLAALEAALAGTPLAVTRIGAAPEYFGRLAHYVDPYDRDSIRRGTLAALAQGRQTRLAEHVRSRFTWQHVAQLTQEVYASLV